MGISEEGMQDPRAAPSHQSAQPAEQLLKNSNDFTKRSKKKITTEMRNGLQFAPGVEKYTNTAPILQGLTSTVML